jgi:hypothetical protein
MNPAANHRETLLVHAFSWIVIAAAILLGIIVAVKLFAPQVGALLVGLGA